MEKSSFFNSMGGDRRYNAADFADYFASFIGNGVFGSPATCLKVVPDTGTNVAVSIGSGWINGYYYVNTSKLLLELPTPDGVLNRIDRIVLRWSLNDRTITACIKSSPLGSAPGAPALQRDTSIYELALGDVYVAAGAGSILEGNITDQRGNSALCGTVSSIVSEAHTHPNATQSAPGFMSANDKKALDQLVTRVTQDVTPTSNVTFKNITAEKVIGAVYG